MAGRACDNRGMWKSISVTVLALSTVVGPSAWQGSGGPQELQSGPDLSGHWTREPVNGATTTRGDGWGPSIEVVQSGKNLTVQPGQGKREDYRLDGVETAEVLSVDGCQNVARVTKALSSRDRVTITTWLVTKPACWHGEVDDEPVIDRPGPIQVRQVVGQRRLERVVVIYRDGNSMTVETTQAKEGLTSNTVTTYRK